MNEKNGWLFLNDVKLIGFTTNSTKVLWKILVKIDFEAAFALIYNIKIVYILLVNKVIYEWPHHMSKNKFTNGTDVFKKYE